MGNKDKVKDAHVCLTNRAGAGMKENITKDHVKSGRAGIYDELRAWPTTPSQSQFAYEGYAYRAQIDNSARLHITAKLGDTAKPPRTAKEEKTASYKADRRFYHVSDEILRHYDCALRCGMKAR